MQVLAIIGLIVGVGYGMDNDWKVAKAYHSYENCRVDHPKHVNSMTSWKYDPCNAITYKLQNK